MLEAGGIGIVRQRVKREGDREGVKGGRERERARTRERQRARVKGNRQRVSKRKREREREREGGGGKPTVPHVQGRAQKVQDHRSAPRDNTSKKPKKGSHYVPFSHSGQAMCTSTSNTLRFDLALGRNLPTRYL